MIGLFTTVGKQITYKAEANDPGIDNLTFTWTFGDNQQPIIHTQTSNGSNMTIDTATHIYNKPGNYTVTLKVKDEDGAEVTYTKTIRIQ